MSEALSTNDVTENLRADLSMEHVLPIKSPASLPDLHSDVEDAFSNEDYNQTKSKKYFSLTNFYISRSFFTYNIACYSECIFLILFKGYNS